MSNLGPAGFMPPSASMLASIERALAAQEIFDQQSPISELLSQLGLRGLHVAQTETDVLDLLQAGAPLDGLRRITDYEDEQEHWETPLLSACVDERFAVADALIRAGANVDAPNFVRDPNGQGFVHTALHMVVCRQDRQSTERLIAAGADVNCQTTTGESPLSYAASNDDAELVGLLLRSGARPDVPQLDGSLPQDTSGPRPRSLLHTAPTSMLSSSYGTQHAPVDDKIDSAERGSYPDGRTELMHWASIGDIARVKSLLDQGADVEAVDEDGDGVLRYAMSRRDAGIFDLLLQRGADPNSISTSAAGYVGFSILHAVSEFGWSDGVESLLNHGADANARGRGGITPMMLAAGADHDSCVSLLRKAGAEVDALDADGDSALFYAASRGRKASVEVLLALGAKADPAPDTSGQTPLTIAAHMASPAGRRQRPADLPLSDYSRIVVDLLRAGASATLMYERGYVMALPSVDVVQLAPLSELSRLVAEDNDWIVINATEAGLRNLLPHPVIADAVPTTAVPGQSGLRSSPRSTRIQIVGPQQRGSSLRPAVRLIWRGREIGRVPHGGRFDLDVDADGELLLQCSNRSTSVPVKLSDAANVYLEWDAWGRLVATRDRTVHPTAPTSAPPGPQVTESALTRSGSSLRLPVSVSSLAAPARSGVRSTPKTTKIQIVGPQQKGSSLRPAVRAIWKGQELGRVPHGGRIDLEIDSDGDLRLECGNRSTSVPVKLADAGTIYLRWDTWGRLLATRA